MFMVGRTPEAGRYLRLFDVDPRSRSSSFADRNSGTHGCVRNWNIMMSSSFVHMMSHTCKGVCVCVVTSDLCRSASKLITSAVTSAAQTASLTTRG